MLCQNMKIKSIISHAILGALQRSEILTNNKYKILNLNTIQIRLDPLFQLHKYHPTPFTQI